MRIAYILNWDMSKPNPIRDKAFKQMREWSKHGATCRAFCVSPQNPDPNIEDEFEVISYQCNNGLLSFLKRLRKFKLLVAKVRIFKPDILYVRSQSYDPALASLMKEYPNVVEVNTSESGELNVMAKKKKWIEKLKTQYSRLTRKKFFKVSKGIVGVTNEIVDSNEMTKYHLPSITVPNGIDYSEQLLTPVPDTTIPKVFFLGGGSTDDPTKHWQGVDEIIELAKLTVGKLEFEIVGPNLVGNLALPENVTVRGMLNIEEYSKVAASCSLGMGTVALYRKNMNEACVFKIRESVAYGLPVILPYKDTAFIDKELPWWVLEVPNREYNLRDHVDEIVSYSESIHGRRVSHEESAPFFSMESLEEKRYQFMLNRLNN